MRFAVYDPWVEIFARHDRPGPGHPANRAGTAHRLRRRTCRPWRQDAAIVRPGPRHAGIGGPSQQPVRREDNGPGSLCRGLRAGNAVAPCLGQWPRHAAPARGFPPPRRRALNQTLRAPRARFGRCGCAAGWTRGSGGLRTRIPRRGTCLWRGLSKPRPVLEEELERAEGSHAGAPSAARGAGTRFKS